MLQQSDHDGRTGLAVVPVFSNGRGCYFAAGANDAFDAANEAMDVEVRELAVDVLNGAPQCSLSVA